MIQTYKITNADPLHIGKSLLKIGSVSTDRPEYARRKLINTITAKTIPMRNPKDKDYVFVTGGFAAKLLRLLLIFFFF